MRKVRRSAIVPHSAEQMFALVDNIESYPEFLPWCNDATEHSRSEEVVEATIELHKGAISKRFTTCNTLHRPEAIDLSLVGGPFRHLEGGWQFQELSDTGCKVSLNLDFEFDNRLVDMMLGPFFEEICNSLVDAFMQRAKEVYA